MGVAPCAGAGAENSTDRDSRDELPAAGQMAKNVTAFEIIKDVLVDGTPILSSMLAVRGSRLPSYPPLSKGTCRLMLMGQERADRSSRPA
jgi:hypothetical protein